MILNVVAHQDDDILFMNPDLANEVRRGDCIRTIYVTSGDGGRGASYWRNRELGPQAAYNVMLGSNPRWQHRGIELGHHQHLVIAQPNGIPNVALIFMRLPDGNLDGSGFKSTNNSSLSQLEQGSIGSIASTDRQSRYSYTELLDTMRALVAFFHPEEVHTQSDATSKTFPDHADHQAVGLLVKQAITRRFRRGSPLVRYYVGYPVADRPNNLSEIERSMKEHVFSAYATDDSQLCRPILMCDGPVYRSAMARQYQNPN